MILKKVNKTKLNFGPKHGAIPSSSSTTTHIKLVLIHDDIVPPTKFTITINTYMLTMITKIMLLLF